MKHNIRTIASDFPERKYAEGRSTRLIITILDDLPPEVALRALLLQEWPTAVCEGCESAAKAEGLDVAMAKIGRDTFAYVKEAAK